jgi:hypothetical protein
VLSSNIDVCVCLPWACGKRGSTRMMDRSNATTSTVSKTLIMPGCRRVRNLRKAFFASGRRDLAVVTSNEKMLHGDESSCNAVRQGDQVLRWELQNTHPLGAVVKSPYRLVNIDSLSKGIGKGRPFGDGRCDSRLEKVHDGAPSFVLLCVCFSIRGSRLHGSMKPM